MKKKMVKMKMKKDKNLIEAYQKMADLTLPKCKKCPCPLSCCSPEYCEITIKHAAETWGIQLERTKHPTLPLMGENGCTAQPHLRPICTVHNCKINALGFDPDMKWTEEYFDLRDKIETLEYEKKTCFS